MVVGPEHATNNTMIVHRHSHGEKAIDGLAQMGKAVAALGMGIFLSYLIEHV